MGEASWKGGRGCSLANGDLDDDDEDALLRPPRCLVLIWGGNEEFDPALITPRATPSSSSSSDANSSRKPKYPSSSVRPRYSMDHAHIKKLALALASPFAPE